MSHIASDLARRLAAAGVEATALGALVNDMASARAEAINREGLQAQTAYLLEAYGPGENRNLRFGQSAATGPAVSGTVDCDRVNRAALAARRAVRPQLARRCARLASVGLVVAIRSPVEAALIYAERFAWPVFPCQWQGPARKRPLITGGFREASTQRGEIERRWRRWPLALIGLATGRRSGIVVLDVDRKGGMNGFDTLDALGAAILPVTPLVHTASGGLHLYFRAPDDEIRNTAGARGRGLGPGLDIRGDGGYVIVPAPRSGYRWDPVCHPGNTPIAPLPAWAVPREIVAPATGKDAPRRPVTGLSPYPEAALDRAVRRIIGAGNGEQEATLNGKAFAIGTLAGAGGIPSAFARAVLIWAAEQLVSYDPRRPWRTGEAQAKVERAFAAGLRSPRRKSG